MNRRWISLKLSSGTAGSPGAIPAVESPLAPSSPPAATPENSHPWGPHRKNSRPSRSAPRAGAFTLLELLLVMSIIAGLAALSAPAFKSLRQTNSISAANRQLLDDLALARLRAINDRSTVYVVFAGGSITNRRDSLIFKAADPELKQWTNLLYGQYASYALYAERHVGDQPGRGSRHYLTEWKTLPRGVFVVTNKFNWSRNPNWLDQWGKTRSQNRSFDQAQFPFPNSRRGTMLFLPYIAFNSQGQLVYKDGKTPMERDEVIPLMRGSVMPPPPGDVFQPADVVETPRGNSTNNFNRIRISWLTGRARLEQPEFK